MFNPKKLTCCKEGEGEVESAKVFSFEPAFFLKNSSPSPSLQHPMSRSATAGSFQLLSGSPSASLPPGRSSVSSHVSRLNTTRPATNRPGTNRPSTTRPSTGRVESLYVVALIEGRGVNGRGDVGICAFDLRTSECTLSQARSFVLLLLPLLSWALTSSGSRQRMA